MFLDGCRESFSLLYQRNIDTLANYGCRLSADRELVKDCIQDVFIDLWSKRANLTIQKSFQSYLFRSLRNRILKKLTNQKGQLIDDLFDDSYLDKTEVAVNADDSSKKESRLKEIQKNIHSLSKREREALYLKYFNNLDNDEIAEVMGVSKDVVYNYVSKAIVRLKSLLEVV